MATKRKAEDFEKDEPLQKSSSPHPAKKQAVEKNPRPTRTEFRDGLFDASTLKNYTESYASSQP